MKRRIRHFKIEVWILLSISICILYGSNLCVEAKETSSKKNEFKLDEYIEYDEVQNVIDEANLNIDFKEKVNEVVNGEDTKVDNTDEIINIGNVIKDKVNEHKDIIIKVVFISLLTAIFTNFTRIFDGAYVSQNAFIVVYMVLVTILINSFYQVYTVAFDVLNILSSFMNVLMPVYTIASFISTGINTASGYSQLTLIVISVIEIIFLKFLLPLINVYMIINLINNINSVNILKRLSEFLKMIIMWGLKMSIIVVTGMGTVRRIIMTSVDTTTKSIINNSLKMTPFIGGNISVVSDTVTSATSLIKDAIGGVSLMVIGIMCLSPLVGIGIYVILYKIITIIVEGIADKRVTNALDSVSNSAKLLLYLVMASALLFTITIALLTV